VVVSIKPHAVLRGARVELRLITGEDAPRLRELRTRPEVAKWWHPLEDDFPLADEPEAVRYAVRRVDDPAVVGLVQYGEENTPEYRHANIDIFLDPAVHGQGLGRDTVRTVALHLIRDRGHHRITIDPAAANAAAIRSYTAVGFRPVGIMRAYELDAETGQWHDGLLMDALAEDIEAAAR
jgi:aminoglycoside 6'-N-acetyltransferase